MTMLHRRDKPTYYELLDRTGKVVATVPRSKLLKRKAELEREHGPLEMKEITDARLDR